MSMSDQDNRTILLDEKQVVQRINRLAYQIYEDNATEKEIIVAGIMKSGYQVAEKIAAALKSISPIKVELAELQINKHSQFNEKISVSIGSEHFAGKSIVLVDDVLNSGKTMLYALKPFLAADIKKIRTVVLVDRNHKRYPISADFAGLSLSTTMKEHVSVEFSGKNAQAWLS